MFKDACVCSQVRVCIESGVCVEVCVCVCVESVCMCSWVFVCFQKGFHCTCVNDGTKTDDKI